MRTFLEEDSTPLVNLLLLGAGSPRALSFKQSESSHETIELDYPKYSNACCEWQAAIDHFIRSTTEELLQLLTIHTSIKANLNFWSR